MGRGGAGSKARDMRWMAQGGEFGAEYQGGSKGKTWGGGVKAD